MKIKKFKVIVLLCFILNTVFLFAQEKEHYGFWVQNRIYWARDSTFETGFRNLAFTLISRENHKFLNYTYEDIVYLFGEPILKKGRTGYILEYPISASLEDCNKVDKAIRKKNKKLLRKYYYKNCQGLRYYLVFYVDYETLKVTKVYDVHDDW